MCKSISFFNTVCNFGYNGYLWGHMPSFKAWFSSNIAFLPLLIQSSQNGEYLALFSLFSIFEAIWCILTSHLAFLLHLDLASLILRLVQKSEP